MSNNRNNQNHAPTPKSVNAAPRSNGPKINLDAGKNAQKSTYETYETKVVVKPQLITIAEIRKEVPNLDAPDADVSLVLNRINQALIDQGAVFDEDGISGLSVREVDNIFFGIITDTYRENFITEALELVTEDIENALSAARKTVPVERINVAALMLANKAVEHNWSLEEAGEEYKERLHLSVDELIKKYAQPVSAAPTETVAVTVTEDEVVVTSSEAEVTLTETSKTTITEEKVVVAEKATVGEQIKTVTGGKVEVDTGDGKETIIKAMVDGKEVIVDSVKIEFKKVDATPVLKQSFAGDKHIAIVGKIPGLENAKSEEKAQFVRDALMSFNDFNKSHCDLMDVILFENDLDISKEISKEDAYDILVGNDDELPFWIEPSLIGSISIKSKQIHLNYR